MRSLHAWPALVENRTLQALARVCLRGVREQFRIDVLEIPPAIFDTCIGQNVLNRHDFEEIGHQRESMTIGLTLRERGSARTGAEEDCAAAVGASMTAGSPLD